MNDSNSVTRTGQNHNNLTLLVYVLLFLGLFNGLTAVIGVIANYVKLDDVRGTLYESHFRWQINTFWGGLAFLVVGGLLVWILVGFLIWGIGAVWLLYRVIKGALCLNEGKPVA